MQSFDRIDIGYYMKILQLCKKFPYPLKDGESIAVSYLSKALHKQGCEISLLSMNTSKHYTDVSALPADYNQYEQIEVVDVDNSIKISEAFLNLFSKESYHVSRFISKEFEAKLVEMITSTDYDVIQLETLYLTPYIDIIKKHSNAIVAMRAHNIEHEIWDRITQNTKSIARKAYLRILTQRLKNYELNHLNDYDYLITVSDRDLDKYKGLGYTNGAMSSPIGLKLNNYTLKKSPVTSQDLCFIGALDWMPNSEGLMWFLDNVWTDYKGDAQLHIAGRNTPDSLKNMSRSKVVVHGEVPNAVEFVSQFPLMVVPLFSGSGTRVKILEGMALGKVVITTTQGLEGIDAQHDEHVLIADNKEEFLTQIARAQADVALQQRIGQAGRKFVENYYDNDAIARQLISKYEALLSSPKYNTSKA